MIEDEELRRIYKVDSEERLQKLEHGLLRLEENPEDPDIIEELFREAHTIKGSSRMIGVENVALLAHRFEDILGSAHRGELKLNKKIINHLYQQLDALKALVQEAITDESSGVDLDAILDDLKNIEGESADKVVKQIPEKGRLEDREVISRPEQTPPVNVNETSPKKSEEVREEKKIVSLSKKKKFFTPFKKDFSIETVRISTEQLDNLVRISGELRVARLRLQEQLAYFEDLITKWDEFNQKFRRLGMQIDDTVYSSMDFSALNLEIGELNEKLEQFQELFFANLRYLEHVTDEIDSGIQEIRLLPFSVITALFPRMVRDLAEERNKKIKFTVTGESTRADKWILEMVKDPLMHLLRNGVDHGIEIPEIRREKGKDETGYLELNIRQTGTSVVIEVKDDGKGLDLEKIKQTALKKGLVEKETLSSMSEDEIYQFIFVPGFSTARMITDISGRGVGMDVVRENLRKLKGNVSITSAPDRGTTFLLTIPRSLSAIKSILFTLREQVYAVPVEQVVSSQLVNPDDIFLFKGKSAILLKGEVIYLQSLSSLLGLDSDGEEKDKNEGSFLNVLVIRSGNQKLALVVDQIFEEQELVYKPFGRVVRRIKNISGAAILGNGEICLILNAEDIIQGAFKMTTHRPVKMLEEVKEVQRILLVEDSFTTRTQEKHILENAGFEVVLAVDGLEALEKLNREEIHAVVSDIQMPRLDGFGLLEKVRKMKKYAEIPFVLVTSLTSDEDKRRGIELGADAYITKAAFNQEILISTLKRLL